MTDIPYAFHNSRNNMVTNNDEEKQNKSPPVTNVNKQTLPNRRTRTGQVLHAIDFSFYNFHSSLKFGFGAVLTFWREG